MNEIAVANRAADWHRLKALVLDSVSSPITKRVYNLGLNEFFAWYALEPRPGFTKATVSAWRVALEARGLGSVSINVRITAVRKLAVEAADNGLLAPELAAGITRVKGAKSVGVRTGNWLSVQQAQKLLNAPDVTTRKGLRDRAMLAILLGCGLRRSEVAALTSDEMLGRLAAQKSIRRTIGRRKSQTQFNPNPQADLALFNQIRLDKDGVEFDEFEASNAVSKLTFCEVTDCERVGDEYRITLKTPFGDTTHTMRIPTQRDVTLYRRTVVSATDLPHGQEEIRYRTEPAIDLYDSVVAKAEGYVDGLKMTDVPPHHKSAVVVELVQAIDDLDPQIDPNS